MFRTFLFLSLASCLVGCGGENGGTGSPVAPTLSATTWNVGLAYGYVAYSTQRQAPVMEAIATLNSDVICLQEVWTPEDQTAAAAALKKAGYNVHIYVSKDPGGGGCTAEEAAPLEKCATESGCNDLPQDDMVNCVVQNCGGHYAALSEGCKGCVASDLTRSIPEIVSNCVGANDAGTYAYKGHNGLVLASKFALKDVKEVDLKASLTWRSYIQATITIASGDKLNLVCTHLTANLSVPYDGDFSGWPEEQAQQLDQLVANLPASVPTVLMGDFNTGPDVETLSVSAELPDNFNKLVTAGWTAHLPGKCTWCPTENQVIGGTGNPHIIDHVITNSAFGANLTATSSRSMDESIQITDEDGDEVDVHLSDHFGVNVQLSWGDQQSK